MMQKGKEKERNREREKRNRGNRKYGQAKLKHSKKGITSCCIAGVVLVMLLGLLAAAYVSGGGAAAYIGALGLIALLLACIGCGNAVRGFKERDKNYCTCKIGVGCNLFFIAGFIAIFCRGLF